MRKQKALTPAQIDALLDDLARDCELDPEAFILAAFPWGEKGGPLEHKRPRKWLLKVARSIGKKLRENTGLPLNMWKVVQEATASGHGIGKSAGMAKLMLWAICTKHCRGVVTANTDTQLRTKTWTEMMKWHSMCIFRHRFSVTATSIRRKSTGDAALDEKLKVETWRIDAIPWSAHNTEAFAGLHNEGERIFLGFDEASGIDDAVWETAEGAMTDAGTQIIWVVWGNPTRARGRFRECWTKFRELWGVRNVDSRTVEGINLDRIARWARIYGEDSQFFNVRVKGQFVEADAYQLISLDWIAAARMRGYMAKGDGSRRRLRISSDISDGGEDDTVHTAMEHYDSIRIGLRQKKSSHPHSIAVIKAAEEAGTMFAAWGGTKGKGSSDDIVVDRMGVGAGTAGTLMNDGYNVIGHAGGEASSNPLRFRNMRVQCYMALRNDFRDGGLALLPDFVEDDQAWDELEEQLCSIRTKPGTEKLEDLQTKEEMKRDGIDSPDRADSLAMQYRGSSPAYVGPVNTLPIRPMTTGSDFLRGADW